MSGGQHRVDEVTRTESRGLDRKNNPRIAAHRPPKETAGLRNAGVCAKGTKKESNTLDAADLVRDVANRDYHSLSHLEIRGAKRISRHLSGQNRPSHLQNLVSGYAGGLNGSTQHRAEVQSAGVSTVKFVRDR